VACVSAHAAIQKAADLMGLRLVLVPMDPATYKADVAAMYVRCARRCMHES
jgi:glutamate/tyrosine decarboxylase-like PLP-dependent enzyme